MADDTFSATTDEVKAKLTVEVPEQALTTLSQLAKQTEAYRVSMEAAARATGDHMGYLEKMPTIADTATKRLKEWCDQVERAVDLKGKLGGMDVPGATGQDSSSPFGSAVLGRGDLASLLNPMANNDPSRVVSMGAGRGMVKPGAVGGMDDDAIKKLAQALTAAVGGGDENDGGGDKKPKTPGHDPKKKPEDDQGLSPRALEQGALKGRDLLGRLMEETGPGASAGDALGAGRDLLGMAEGAGGMLGKVGGMLGPVGAAAGLALTANQLIQMGGQKVQDYRNLGIEGGGGFGEGVGYDTKAKMMALDPFISTAQAREVIQGALSSGHGGDSFDTVTQFLAKNLKDMNVSVGDSVQMLKKNVDEGGQSIEQLGQALSNATAGVAGGHESQSETVANLGQNMSTLTNLGVANQGAIANEFMGQFAGSELLKNVGTDVIQGALGNPAFVQQLGAVSGVSGATPDVLLRKLGASGQLGSASNKVLAKAAAEAKRSSNDPDMQVEAFLQRLRLLGLGNINAFQAKELMDSLTSPGGADAATQAGKDATQAANKPIDRGDQTGDQALGGIQGALKGLINIPGNLWDDVTAAAGGDFHWKDMAENLFPVTQIQKGAQAGVSSATKGTYSTAGLDNAVAQYGAQDLIVYDKSGKPIGNLNQDDKGQRDKLISEDYMIGRKGQQPQTLTNFGAQAQAASEQKVNVTASPITVSYQGPITGPTSVPMTTNQMQANTGTPGATLNKPPVGDR